MVMFSGLIDLIYAIKEQGPSLTAIDQYTCVSRDNNRELLAESGSGKLVFLKYEVPGTSSGVTQTRGSEGYSLKTR